MRDGKPIIIFECKQAKSNLSNVHASQLHRYFTAVHEVRFAVVTNGIDYYFHTDIDAPNRMDDNPFFKFNMLSFHERDVSELKKFTKSSFNIEEIATAASELKYTASIKRVLASEFENPSEDLIIYLAKQVYSGRMNANAKEQFTDIIRKAMRSFLNEQINKRLKQAIDDDVELSPSHQAVEEFESEEDTELDDERTPDIHTTEDEIEGFFAIKSILRDSIDVKRVHMRDTKSYCGILLDDNNRKPIVRLRFNRSQWYLGVFDSNKNEEKIAIGEIDDIYNYADRVKAIISVYE